MVTSHCTADCETNISPRVAFPCVLFSHLTIVFLSMKEIQVRTGHNDYSTTANIYSHIQDTDKQKFADTIGKALSN